MHWLFFPAKRPDHINRDRLDNRRDNLRPATHLQNTRNQKLRPGKVPFKGVHPKRSKFCARICVNRRGIHLGTFPTAEEAARAYDKAAIEVGGEFAATNERLGLLPAIEAE